MDFELSPVSSSTAAILGGLTVFILALAALFAWIAWSASHLSVAVSEDAIHLRVPIYSRSVPISSLDLTKAKVLKIEPSSGLRPVVRTNGIGVPGFRVGWFRLKNGEKALLAVTSLESVLYIPTLDGYSLLLSLKKPHRALDELRAKGKT